NPDRILPLPKRMLLLANALVWGAPGLKITWTGIAAYIGLRDSDCLAWLIAGTLAVLCCFVLMFNKIVAKYSSRILAFPEAEKSLLFFLPARGWILVSFMMCLGISLKFIPGIPAGFFASFYSGLGPALVYAALKFLAAYSKACPRR
ncbi:MAG: hypothetical protein ACI399_06715, partial [Candidatus Cryptobacteroides sp.]